MSEQRFDDTLLESFIEGFYGYGNFEGDYWFVGLEQGGGNSFEEVQKRLEVWNSNGRPALEDAAEYHRAIGLGHFFDPAKPKLQSTWARLIRTLYGYEGHEAADTKASEIKTYQRDQFLRSKSNECSIELLPLPSPSMNKWLYADHSELSYLSSRADYRARFAQQRADTIRQHIDQYAPKFVMFYGLHPEYTTWWRYIADIDFITVQIVSKFSAEFAKVDETTFIISRHPVAHGTTNEYWHELGKTIAQY